MYRNPLNNNTRVLEIGDPWGGEEDLSALLRVIFLLMESAPELPVIPCLKCELVVPRDH